MYDKFQFVLRKLIQFTRLKPPLNFDTLLTVVSSDLPADRADTYRAINYAFLIALGGEDQPGYKEANAFLAHLASFPDWEEVSTFYLNLRRMIEEEIERVISQNQDVAQGLESLSNWLRSDVSEVEETQIVERFWSFFHPEAAGIRFHESTRVADLRQKRKITITNQNPQPIEEPAQEILFTANALLTTPPDSLPLDKLPVSRELHQQLGEIIKEEQIFWYDHPIQVGTEPENNEVLYGLRGLQEALDFEHSHGTTASDAQLTCLLSVSVTHDGLRRIARQYLGEELLRSEQLPGLNIYTFTESDTNQLIEQILAPAAEHYIGQERTAELLQVFGVDGEYGRHYTFLKAIAAFWSVLIDPQIKATFKIDLDQVFPQDQLREYTGSTAFEHFKSPLWGAQGSDARDEPVELGMIAGALVNEGDIERGLFTPDVPFPPQGRSLNPEEWVFFSQLPQALSTEAEMMARCNTDELDGNNNCLQRVHITGGTTGILVESLRRQRPFTPSFIGRAEDQAFILSTLDEPGAKLAYLHKDGLIMRHDKGAFAQEAIQAAQVGKLIGDFVRILYFSAYAQVLKTDISSIKDRVDPFTGSFISYIPITLTALRFALKAEALFQDGRMTQGEEFISLGANRIGKALQFAFGEGGNFERQYRMEVQGWALYYDILLALERGIQVGDPLAEDLRRKAKELISGLAI